MEEHDGSAHELLGREFTSAVVMFHEAVGRLLGLSGPERKCLDVLDRLGPVPAGRIAEHTGLTTGAITGMIDRLVKAGYVERRPNPADRRSVLVALRENTPRDRILPMVFGPLAGDMAEVASHFTSDQLASIGDYLARTTDVLHRRTRELSELDAPPERHRSGRARTT